MRKKMTYVIGLCLLLFSATSCSDRDELYGHDAKVDLAITVAAGNPTSRAALADAEKINTLRVIVVSETTGSIEHNKLVYAGSAIDSYTTDRLSVKANDTKKIYLLANSEDVPGLYPGSISDTEGIGKLEDFVLDNPLTANGYVPSTAVHEIVVKDMDKDLTSTPLYVVHAACKLTLEIENKADGDVILTNWQLDKAANRSFLMPHIDEENWMDIMFKDSEKDDSDDETDEGFVQWITAYDIPMNVQHEPLSSADGWEIKVAGGNTSEFGLAYLHESRFLPEGKEEQEYEFSLKVNGVQRGPVKLPHLKSLVRNTHVVVHATITSSDISWMVTVHPYGSYTLDPVFGL